MSRIEKNFFYLPNIKKAKVALIVNVGSLDDNYSGMAHFIEHMLIMTLNERKKLNTCDFKIRAYTDFDRTIYLIECPNISDYIYEACSILEELYSGQYLCEYYMEGVRQDVINEIELVEKEEHWILPAILNRLGIYNLSPVGVCNDVKKISFENLRKFFNQKYTVAATNLLIVGDISIEPSAIQFMSETHIQDVFGKNPKLSWKKNRFPFTLKKNGEMIFCLPNEYIQMNNVYRVRVINDFFETMLNYLISEYMEIEETFCYIIRYKKGISFFYIKILETNLIDKGYRSIPMLLEEIVKNLSEEMFEKIRTEFIEMLSEKKQDIEENIVYDCISCIEDGIAVMNYKQYILQVNNILYGDMLVKFKQLLQE